MRYTQRLRPLPYREFRQHVRLFPRVPLLRLIAQAASSVTLRRISHEKNTPEHIQEFTLAGVARTCLASSNERSRNQPTPGQLSRLCHEYINIDDPRLGSEDRTLDDLLRPIMFEQFPVQFAPKSNVARAYALCVRHMKDIPQAPTPKEWEAHFGVDFASYLRIGFTLSAAFTQNNGRLTWDLLTTDRHQYIWGTLGFDTFVDVVNNWFAQPIDAAAASARANQQDGREKWSFNPLQARPVILVSNELICPAPHFLLDKISAAGLYYTGSELFGSRFTKALGQSFENYVGELLGLLREATVHSEIVYNKGQNKSCDYIVEAEHAVLLVEVKIARPLLAYRTGDDTETSLRRVRDARDQLVKTAQRIRERHPQFQHIPCDREIIGLVVTLEPYFLGHTADDHTLKSRELTITSAWSHELENVTAHLSNHPSPGQALLEHWHTFTDRSDEPITGIVNAETATQNPIVQDDFDAALNFADLPPKKS